jgi:hypothetical protein
MESGATAHADSSIWVQRSPWPCVPGTFTCLVILEHGGDRRVCLLSAQHVLSPYADADGAGVDGGWPLYPCAADGTAQSSPTLGRTLAIGGLLQGDNSMNTLSFDAQLAEPDERMIPLVPLRRFHPGHPWVKTPTELEELRDQDPRQFRLLTPDNCAVQRGAVPLEFVAMPAVDKVVSISYRLSRDGEAIQSNVRQNQLVVFKAESKTLARGGDSGAPVVVMHADGSMTLVAMHIAGNELGTTWAIPAWRLFDPSSWAVWPTGATIVPMDVPFI